MPTMLLRALSDFRTLRRPCITYEPEVVDRKWFKKTKYNYLKEKKNFVFYAYFLGE